MWSSIESVEQVPDEIEVRVDYYRKSDYADLKNALKQSRRSS
jgi:hypothetical protein